jgi:hypothetical protein
MHFWFGWPLMAVVFISTPTFRLGIDIETRQLMTNTPSTANI